MWIEVHYKSVVLHAHLVFVRKLDSDDTWQKAESGYARTCPERRRQGFGRFRFHFDNLRHFPPPHLLSVGNQTTRGGNGGQQ